jgi:hypothetical protein
VNAYYRGGSSVIDFSDPRRPKEIAFADMRGTNTWSAYTYPRKSGRERTIPVYSNDGLSRNYGGGVYPEAAYGFMRFQSEIGRTKLVGFDRLNPQLQERVIDVDIDKRWGSTKSAPRTYAKGTPAPDGAVNRTARPVSK